MTESELQSCVKVVAELTSFYTIVTPLQFDTIVCRMSNVQTVEMPVISCKMNTTITNFTTVATTINQLLLKIKDGSLAIIVANGDRGICCTRSLDTHGKFTTTVTCSKMITTTTTDDGITWFYLIDGMLQVHPWMINGAITSLVITIRSNIVITILGVSTRALYRDASRSLSAFDFYVM